MAKKAFAQTSFSTVASNSAASSLISKILDAVVIPVVLGMFLVAGLVFVWGVFGLIMHADDSAARTKGQQHVLWGVIGLAIMISVYGLVRFIASSFGMADPFA